MKKEPGHLEFPILTSPATAFNLLLGKDVDLFRYTLPSAGIDLSYSQAFQLWGPLFVGSDGSIDVGFDLQFGFDTSGLREYIQTVDLAHGDLGDPELVLNGFYLGDHVVSGTDKAEAWARTTVAARAGVGIGGLVEAGARGGVKGTLEVDLAEPDHGDTEYQDGKVRFGEMWELLSHGSPFCLVELSGQLSAFLEAYIWAGLDLGLLGKVTLFEHHHHLFNTVVASFDYACPANPPDVASQDANGVVLLHMGPNADLRGGDFTEDGAEEFEISKYTDSDTGQTFTRVKYRGVSEGFSGVTRIVGYAGAGDDRIVVKSGITAPVELHGGAGNDQFEVKGDTAAELYGDDGDDLLVGGALGDVIHGGAGLDADIINAGEDNDLVYGDDGDDLVHGDAGNDPIYGGAGTDLIHGDAGDDVIDGEDNVDELYGDIGNDTISGGAADDVITAGDDRLWGDGGSGSPNDVDWLFAGQGNDDLIGGQGTNVLAAWSMAPFDPTDPTDPTDLSYLFDPYDPTIHTQFGIFVDDEGNLHDDDGGGQYELENTGLNRILGQAGNDVLYGGTGVDFLYGNGGDDRLVRRDGSDFESLDGGTGGDEVAVFSGRLPQYDAQDPGNDQHAVGYIFEAADVHGAGSLQAADARFRFMYDPPENSCREIRTIVAGDLNGDGMDDLVAAYPDGGGHVETHLGRTSGGQDIALGQAGASDDPERWGTVLAALGDINADGYDDFAVGKAAFRYHTAIQVYNGHPEYSYVSGVPLWLSEGTGLTPGQYIFADAAVSAGDFNHDGQTDLGRLPGRPRHGPARSLHRLTRG